METQAKRATNLARKIYASLPWGYRMAQVFLKLTYSTQETFGRFCYAKFIQAGVEGLPDINGAPALSLKDLIQGPRGESKLPAGYGRHFGEMAWKTGLQKLHSPEIVEDALSMVTMKLVAGKIRIQEGSPLARAEGFLLTAVITAGLDIIRIQRGRRNQHVEVSMPEDEHGTPVDLRDPKSFDRIEDLLSPSDLKNFLADIAHIDRRAPEWFNAQLDGMSNVELAKEWDVSPAYVTKWTQAHLDKIKAVVYKHIRDAT